MTRKELAGPIDREAGARLCAIRKMRGLSQEKLGAALGITFQQIQKYEKGTNRISLSALKLLSVALECHPMEIVGEDDTTPARFIEDFQDAQLKELRAKIQRAAEALA